VELFSLEDSHTDCLICICGLELLTNAENIQTIRSFGSQVEMVCQVILTFRKHWKYLLYDKKSKHIFESCVKFGLLHDYEDDGRTTYRPIRILCCCFCEGNCWNSHL